MNRLLLAAGALLLLVGCASAPTHQVASMDELVGTWTGMSYYKGGSAPVTLTITPDGAYTSKVGTNAAVGGKVTIEQAGRVFWTSSVSDRKGEWTLAGKGADMELIAQGSTAPNKDGWSTQYEARLKRK